MLLNDKNQKKYQSSFNRWARLRITTYSQMRFVIIFTLFLFGPLLWQIPQKASLIVSTILNLAVLSSIIAVALVIIFFTAKYDRVKLSRAAVIYTVKSTIDDLDDEDLIKAALSLNMMLLAISDYLSQKSLRLGELEFSPVKYIGIDSSSIIKRNLSFYLQSRCDTADLKLRLSKMATSLISNNRLAYRDISDLMIWLGRDTEDIGETEKNFTDKHQSLMKLLPLVLSFVGPLIVATIGFVINSNKTPP